MKLAALDRHPNGNFPLRLVVQWLDTLTKSGTWSPGQLAAAREAVSEARELLETDVLTLAGRLYPPGSVPPPRKEYLLPFNAAERDADWDSLVSGTVPPWDLEGGWAWARVVVFDAPGLRAHDVNDPALCEDEGCPQHGTPHVCFYPKGSDLRNVAQALAGTLPAGTVVRLSATAPDPHNCRTCRFLDTCGAHQEPCSRCVVGSGEGGGHADRWESRA